MAWIADGSSQITVDGSIARCAKGDGSTYNAMWKDGEGITTGEHAFRFTFTELNEGAFIGLSNDEKFAAGYKIKCISYGGNLSNGSALLVGDFGPRFVAGDVVDMVVSIEGADMLVYFAHNSTPLGLGYKMPASSLPNARPIVKFSESGAVTCTKLAQIPNVKTRTGKTCTGISGSWKLKQLTGAVIPAESGSVTIKLEESAGKFVGNAHVINNIRLSVWEEEGTWKATGGVMTRMGGSDEMMAFENSFSTMLFNPTSVSSTADGHLHYNSSALQSVWDRYDATPSHFEGNPFA